MLTWKTYHNYTATSFLWPVFSSSYKYRIVDILRSDMQIVLTNFIIQVFYWTSTTFQTVRHQKESNLVSSKTNYICTIIIGEPLTFIKNVEEFDIRKTKTVLINVNLHASNLWAKLKTRFSLCHLSLHLLDYTLT